MEVIAAISTPRGKGGVALIRISGDGAFDVASRVFIPANGAPLCGAKARTAVFGTVVMPGTAGTAAVQGTGNNPDTKSAPNAAEEIDTGLCTLFPAPHSFTGEDTAEITCHGGVLVTSLVLTACLTAGARQATAGEFTRRAFLNGKMNLDAAEALGTLLEAKTNEQLKLSHAGMRGILSDRTSAIYNDLKHVLSSVFAKIDYPDEDLAEMSRDEIVEAVSSVRERLCALAATYRTGRAVMEGIPTVIAGRANAGKSSLYNLLSGHDAAIVTDIAGTTRDVLTETVSLGKVTLRLSDTAGIRDTTDRVEQIGVERALRELDGAGLVLAAFDGSSPLSDDDRALIARLSATGNETPVIAVLGKSDLPAVLTEADLHEAFAVACGAADGTAVQDVPAAVVSVSAKYGNGLDRLTDTVEALFIDGRLDTAADPIVVNARQHAAVLRAADFTDNALSSLSDGLPVDLSCDDLESAMSALSELSGREVSEDVVTDIFSRFCVGK